MSTLNNTANPVSMPAVPDALVRALDTMRAPVLIAHVTPDADALGSMLATAIAWSSDACHPRVSLPAGSVSQRLAFLFDWAGVPAAATVDFGRADGFVVFDTAKKERCNIEQPLKQSDWAAGRPVVNIDHHATNTQFGDVNWVIAQAGSTSEIVYYLLRAACRPISPVAASLLYAGMQTDTIGFSLRTTTASALRAAADLVEAGADVGELGERLGRSQRPSEFRLLRTIYANTRIDGGGRLAYSSAGFDEIQEAGCRASDIDDQVNVPGSLEGVQLAMLFSEGNRGKTRINFRGSGPVTVVELARRFSGGGHAQAAGAILDCGLREAMEKVIPQALEHLEGFRKE